MVQAGEAICECMEGFATNETTGDCIAIDAQFFEIPSCVGDSIQYLCTVESRTHTWEVPGLPDKTLTPRTDEPITSFNRLYIFQLEDVGNTGITSSLTVTSFPNLNNTVFLCRDGDAPLNHGDLQEITVRIRDLPSAPSLDVVAIDLQTFTFTISPPLESSQCVLNYTITPVANDGSVLPVITVRATDTEAPVTVTRSGFDMCNTSYSFSVAAVTLSGTGENSEIITPEEQDLLTPELTLSCGGFNVTISAMPPINSPSFFESTVTIRRGSLVNDSCEEIVASQMESSQSPMTTVLDTLSCRYAGRQVTYCLQFSIAECQSSIATETTPTLPSLLASLHDVTPSTSDGVSVLVNVNEQANCVGVEGLTINATIKEGETIISSQVTDFTDTKVTFESTPPGNYTCSATVEDGTGPIETVQIPCQLQQASTSPDSAPELTLSCGGFNVTVSAMPPINSPSFFESTVTIRRGSLVNDSCEEIVASQMGSSQSQITVSDTLSCRYAGRQVTYCLQFSIAESQSSIIMETTPTLPTLLASLHDVTPSTSDGVSVLVNVNEQANCVGMEGLTINATIKEGETLISSQVTDFTDTKITFESTPPGNYTCSATIEDGTGPIETVQIPCQFSTSPDPANCSVDTDGSMMRQDRTTLVGVVVGVVCSVCFFSAGILVGAMAGITVYRHACNSMKVQVAT